MFKKAIDENETEIEGGILLSNGTPEYDTNAQRIQWLVRNYLKLYATCDSNWSAIFIDPNTNLYWKHELQNSAYHGGGIPKLFRLDNLHGINDLVFV